MNIKENKKVIRILSVLLCAFLALGLLTGCGAKEDESAEQQSTKQTVVLESYGLNVQVTNRYRMIVTETLTVNYTNQIDSICRVIPYEGYRFDPAKNEVIRYRMTLDQIDVDADYSVKKEAGKAYLTIGAPAEGKASGGTQIYTLKYRLSCYQDEDTQRDLLFCNLLPYGWEDKISSANISVTMPKDFSSSNVKLYRYSGGSWVESTATYTASEKSISAYLDENVIGENAELCMQIRLEEGYFKGEKSLVPLQVFFNILIIVVTLGILALWWFFGRPVLREKAATVKKHKLTPLEDAYLLRNTLTMTDFAAFLSYWANNGVIRITQLSANDYSITGLNPPEKSAKNFEITLYQLLFGDGVKTKSLQAATAVIRRNTAKIKRQVKNSCCALCAGRLYTLESLCAKAAAWFFSVMPIVIVLAVGGHVALDYSAGYIGLIAAAVLLLIHLGVLVLKQSWKNLPKIASIILAAICGIAEVTVLGGTVYYAASVLGNTGKILMAVIALLLMQAAAMLSGRKSEGYQTQLSQLYAYKRYLRNPETESENISSFYYGQLPQAYVLRVGKAFSKKCDSYPLAAHDGLMLRGEEAKLSHAAGFYPYYQSFISAVYRASNAPEEKRAALTKDKTLTQQEAPKEEAKAPVQKKPKFTMPKFEKGFGASVLGVLAMVWAAIVGVMQKLAYWINEAIDWVGDKFKKGDKEAENEDAEEKED